MADNNTNMTDQNNRKSSAERKLRMADKRVSLRMSLIFFAFMLLIAIFLLVFPRPKVSDIERRDLAKWPEFTVANYFSGDFTNGITQYYDDTVPFRDSFKNAGNNIKRHFGITSSNTAEIVGTIKKVQDVSNDTSTDKDNPGTPDTVDPDSEYTAETAEAETEATEPETKETTNSKDYRNAEAEGSLEDSILIIYQDDHWRALPLYSGAYEKRFADAVNYVYHNTAEGVNVYVMPCPLATQFYLPANYEGYSADEEEVYQKIAADLDEGVVSIDIIPTLNDHNEENIYLRTDHHWTPLGAYYGSREFAKAAGVQFAPLDEDHYTEYVNEGYVGTMYAFTESANILNDPEEFRYYVPNNSYTVDYYSTDFKHQFTMGLFWEVDLSYSYGTFMGGDYYICKVTTDVDNDRVLLVIKDSYGNAQIPYYTQSFHQIYVIDQRYFDLNLISFIYSQGVTDVLFTYNYYSFSDGEVDMLEEVVYSNYDVEYYDDAPEPVLPDRGNKTADDAEEYNEAGYEDYEGEDEFTYNEDF